MNNKRTISYLVLVSPVFILSLTGFFFFRTLADSKSFERFLFASSPSQDLNIYSGIFASGSFLGYAFGIYFSKNN